MAGRAFIAAVALDALTGAAWAGTTVLTSAGPPPYPRLTSSPARDVVLMTSMVTGSTAALLAVLATVNIVIFLIAVSRASSLAARRRGATPEPKPAGDGFAGAFGRWQ